jgi:hypothetical protein
MRPETEQDFAGLPAENSEQHGRLVAQLSGRSWTRWFLPKATPERPQIDVVGVGDVR